MYADDGGGGRVADYLRPALHIRTLFVAVRFAVQPALIAAGVDHAEAAAFEILSDKFRHGKIEVAFLDSRIHPRHAAVRSAVSRVDDDGHGADVLRKHGDGRHAQHGQNRRQRQRNHLENPPPRD